MSSATEAGLRVSDIFSGSKDDGKLVVLRGGGMLGWWVGTVVAEVVCLREGWTALAVVAAPRR